MSNKVYTMPEQKFEDYYSAQQMETARANEAKDGWFVHSWAVNKYNEDRQYVVLYEKITL